MQSAAVNMDTRLFDVPPSLMKTFCEILDSGAGDDRLGWRELAARIVPSLLEVRRTERVEARGKSPTWELMWSWAQQLTTVGDLLKVLQDMGHHRAIQLFIPDWAAPGCVAEQPKASGGHVSLPEPTVNGADEDPHQPEEMSPPSSLVDITATEAGLNQRPLITYQDVIEGTRGFHDDMKIAEGQFADVYKGQRGSKAFVVKVFKQLQVNKTSWKKQWDLFRKEAEVHSLRRHQNILEFWGCFSEEDRCCFIYPYLPTGSLYDCLHKQGSGARRMSWQQRLDVIKGTAKAVHHLHQAQPCSVICGNICSSNILLDERLCPKLSSFGTAHLRPHSASQSSNTTTTLDTRTHRNLGYLPDEFIRNPCKLTLGLDIYSLGMVIMETITGRKVIEEPKRILRNDILTAEEEAGGVDGCLRFLDLGAGAWPRSVSLSLFRLALDCTAHHRSRPNCETVLQVLSQLLPLPSPPPGDQSPPPSYQSPLPSYQSPLPSYQSPLPSDQPHTLDAGARAYAVDHSPSIPVEDDEHQLSPTTNPGPCECSQSEVTYLSCDSSTRDSSRRKPGRRPSQESREASSGLLSREEEEPVVDLYNSWPVQCSCAAEAAGLGCDDCMANGFTPDQSHHHHTPHDDSGYPSHGIAENPAKERMRNKFDQYNKGLIKTEELLSMTR